MSKKISLALDLDLSGDTLTGGVRNGSGPGREFSGWLGLLGAIDGLVAEHGRPPAEPEPSEAAGGSDHHIDPEGT